MKYPAFRAASERAFDEIPEQYKQGIEDLVVSREARPSREHGDVWTMGECLTESWPSEFGGPDTTRSSVVLYWGSFRAMAREDAEFDWEGEIWETLTHELRHHLESLASDDRLEGVDYAMDEGFKREDGHDFDPWYYQRGDREGQGAYRVEHDVFLEQTWTAERFDAATEVAFEWQGKRWTIPRPETLGDVHFVRVFGVVEEPDGLELVLVRRRSLWQSVTRMVGRAPLDLLESEADAEPAD